MIAPVDDSNPFNKDLEDANMLVTVFGEKTDTFHVLQEYPRPQLRRDSYLNLNGYWEYSITHSEAEPDLYDGRILVPFSPEAPLSGVGRILSPGEFLWYKRDITLPQGFIKNRVLLHFGAVDREATVFINGKEVFFHSNGYLPFTVDITEYIEAEQFILTLCVTDDTDASYHTRGKQSSKPKGIWYTSQSGIWQTVWIESVPKTYIKSIRYTPYCECGEIGISVYTSIPCACSIQFSGKTFAVASGKENRIPLPGFRYWSPEDPYLYDVTVCAGEDTISSYFAMRSFAVRDDSNGIPRLFLNGKPYFQKGVLDQGYWPEGLYTAPSDEAIIYDIGKMKQMGFNMLRKHIKVEPLRWYYHCDRLGMLVWQDMPSGGEPYSPLTVTLPLFTGKHIRDDRYNKFGRNDERGRWEFMRELKDTVQHLYNCPCISMWVPFNEGWGQFDANRAVSVIREMDNTRTIDHASGWHDQNGGDVKSLHVYFRLYRHKQFKGNRAVVLSEFGGYHLFVKGHCRLGHTFGYRGCKDKEQFNRSLRKLFDKQIIPAVRKGLSATVYTQLSDVECELNGLLTYDRKIIKADASLVREINRKLTLEDT